MGKKKERIAELEADLKRAYDVAVVHRRDLEALQRKLSVAEMDLQIVRTDAKLKLEEWEAEYNDRARYLNSLGDIVRHVRKEGETLTECVGRAASALLVMRLMEVNYPKMMGKIQGEMCTPGHHIYSNGGGQQCNCKGTMPSAELKGKQ